MTFGIFLAWALLRSTSTKMRSASSSQFGPDEHKRQKAHVHRHLRLGKAKLPASCASATKVTKHHKLKSGLKKATFAYKINKLSLVL